MYVLNVFDRTKINTYKGHKYINYQPILQGDLFPLSKIDEYGINLPPNHVFNCNYAQIYIYDNQIIIYNKKLQIYKYLICEYIKQTQISECGQFLLYIECGSIVIIFFDYEQDNTHEIFRSSLKTISYQAMVWLHPFCVKNVIKYFIKFVIFTENQYKYYRLEFKFVRNTIRDLDIRQISHGVLQMKVIDKINYMYDDVIVINQIYQLELITGDTVTLVDNLDISKNAILSYQLNVIIENMIQFPVQSYSIHFCGQQCVVIQTLEQKFIEINVNPVMILFLVENQLYTIFFDLEHKILFSKQTLLLHESVQDYFVNDDILYVFGKQQFMMYHINNILAKKAQELDKNNLQQAESQNLKLNQQINHQKELQHIINVYTNQFMLSYNQTLEQDIIPDEKSEQIDFMPLKLLKSGEGNASGNEQLSQILLTALSQHNIARQTQND